MGKEKSIFFKKATVFFLESRETFDKRDLAIDSLAKETYWAVNGDKKGIKNSVNSFTDLEFGGGR